MFTKEIEHRINIIDAGIARHTTALSELNMERTKLLIGIEVIKDYETKKDTDTQQSVPVKKQKHIQKQNTDNIKISLKPTPISPNDGNKVVINNIPKTRKSGLTQTIFKVLDSTKHGLSSQILLEKINKEFGEAVDQKAFYPTMSRLFKEKRIMRSERTKKWKLVGTA